MKTTKIDNPAYEISVVIPVFNQQSTILKAVKSVIDQNFKNLEIIIVDDGSTDDTPKICDKLDEQYKNISVYHIKNSGVSVARAVGIDKSKGKYIGFVDADDFAKVDLYQVLYDNMKNYNAEISACEIIRVYPKRSKNYGKSHKIYSKNTKEALKILMKNKKYGSYFNNKLFKKDLFKDVDIPPVNVLTDFYIMHKIFGKAKNIVFEDTGYYYYVESESSITTKRTLAKYKNVCLAHEVRYDSPEAKGFQNILAKNFLNIVAVQAKMYMYNPEISEKERTDFNSFIDKKLKKFFSCKKNRP